MKTTLSISVFLILFISCKSNKKVTQNKDEKFDIVTYVEKLDSMGYDVSTDTLIFDFGKYILYTNNTPRGNQLMKYALSKRDSLVAEDFREWSVQNTKNGNYSFAIDKLEKAMKIDAREVSAYYGWLLLYYYRDYEKALTTLELHDSYTPNFADAPMGEDIHYLKGLCQMQMENYETAVEEFDLYINHLISLGQEDFVDVYTFVNKGNCLSKLGEQEEAIKSYDKAIKYYEECTEAFYFKGLALVEINEKSKACENFSFALDLIGNGYKSKDTYVEYFHEIYSQQIKQSMLDHCDG